MVFFQRAEEFIGSNITLFQTSPTHVNFEVSTTPSWVVEEWNGLESSHLASRARKTWVFERFSNENIALLLK